MIRIVRNKDSDTVTPSNLLKKGGEKSVKFVKILATIAFAVTALGLGACANKPKPAPAPASLGTSK